MMAKFILFTALFWQNSVWANPEVVFSSDRPFAAFLDQAFKQTVLLTFQEEAQAQIWDLQQEKVLHHQLLMADERCTSPTLLYAHPFLTDAETTCYVDELLNEITFLGKTSPPSGHFSFIYFFQDEDKLYFLFNGREFPRAKSGYLKAKVVYRDGSEHFLQDLIGEIPRYSGAMYAEDNAQRVLYTMATGLASNELYSLPQGQLKELISQKAVKPFSAVAKKIYGPFAGLGLTLFSGRQNYLYYNKSIQGEYESYTLDKERGVRKTVSIPEECHLLGKHGQRWLFHCRQRDLVYYSELFDF